MIHNLCQKSTLPPNYFKVLFRYTMQGYRVIACASKIIEVSEVEETCKSDREDVEQDLVFLGFLIFENKLKPVTTEIITKLKDANMKVMMVTGDNPFTAINVAIKCNILPKEKVLLFLGTIDTSGDQMKKDLSNNTVKLQKRDLHQQLLPHIQWIQLDE